jgi:hypothetical protein
MTRLIVAHFLSLLVLSTSSDPFLSVTRKERVDDQGMKRKVISEYSQDGDIPAEEPRKRIRKRG